MEIVTFYSYKGGAGRSSTALNTLPYLVKALGATEENPILLLDMDLDSAGMTYLLGLDVYFQKNYDIKQFLMGDESWPISTSDLKTHPLYQKFVPVGERLGVEDKSVVFLGDNDEKPLDNDQMGGAKEEIFRKLKQFGRKNGIKAIVIDSSAGDQFSALLSTQAASVLVCCMRPTMQFRIGTFNYLHRIAERAMEGSLGKKIVILPTVVPDNDKFIDGEYQKKKAISNILERIDSIAIDGILTDFIDENCFGINDVERFRWKEGVLYKVKSQAELSADEDVACERYEKLAELIARE